jgi:hypothetical protein
MTPFANRPRRCARCGSPLLSVLDLAVTAQRARKALDGMRLAVPDDLTRGVRSLASALACHAGTCWPEGPRDAA